jgi:hypothetical protein
MAETLGLAMFWSSAYTRFLEEEVKRLQNEHRVLVSVLLERSGHHEAAHMLRGDNPQEQAVAVQKAEQTGIIEKLPEGRSGMRHKLAMLSAATRPKPNSDSVSRLEDRVKGQTQ